MEIWRILAAFATAKGNLISKKVTQARVAELADAQDLKSCVLTDVRVQVPPRVLWFFKHTTVSFDSSC